MLQATRRLAHVDVAAHPSAAWTLQQMREVVAGTEDHRYLIHSRDDIFSKHLHESIRALGLTVLRSPFASPKANAISERVIGTIRRECLDWIAPTSEARLRWILRPHGALGDARGPPERSARPDASQPVDGLYESRGTDDGCAPNALW
jgi:putative transposase